VKLAGEVTPPPVAEIYRILVEAGALGDAVKVQVAEQVGLQLAGVNTLAVTPVGRTVKLLNVTGVVVPPRRVAETVSTPLGPPGTIVRVEGLAARQKSIEPPVLQVTTRLKVAVLVTPPPTA